MSACRERGHWARPAPNEGTHVSRRLFRSPLILSPLAAIAAQVLLAGLVAASTGGGDFPWRR